jgi:two-component system chemotaxis sensor kinase CheA
MKTFSVIQASRLLEHLEEALLVVDPDLIVRETVSEAARELGRGPQGERPMIGQHLLDAIGPLFAPRARFDLLPKIKAALAPEAADSLTLRGVEGAATAAARAAGLTRYFDIAVRRYLGDEGPLLSLGIRDVTERLRLGRALESARQAHELAVAVLSTEPLAMRGFLQDAASSMALIQSLLRVPARMPAAFRDKLGRMITEVRTLRERAAQLGVGPVATQCADYETALESLRDLESPSGDEFLPLAVQLDELFTLITTASQLAEQRAVSQLQPTAPPGSGGARRRDADSDWPRDVSTRLGALVERVAREKECRATLQLNGLDTLPDCYRRSVDHMLLQLVRNAVEHGIEPEAARRATRKPAEGSITVDCTRRSQGGFEISVRDDGRGFDVGLIGRVAVEKGLISAETLAASDPRTLFALIFRPGFTTEGVEGCAGKGLGMVFLRELVTRMDGHVSVATKAGRYTRFRIQLPEAHAQAASATGAGQRVA